MIMMRQIGLRRLLKNGCRRGFLTHERNDQCLKRFLSSSWSYSKEEIRDYREVLRGFAGSNTEEDRVSLQLSPTTTTSTATITLSNVSNRNALTGKMMAELADVVDTLEEEQYYSDSDDSSCLSAVILRGDDKFFCAGADIDIVKKHLSTRQDGGKIMSTVMMDTLDRFHRLPYITVAAIQGMAMGGGAELCTACDYRIISQNSSIQFVHAKMGLTPGWGGAIRLVKLVGRQNALTLLGTSQLVSAQDCLNMGLVDVIVQEQESDDDDDDDMEKSVNHFLNRFGMTRQDNNNAYNVLRAAKQVVVNAAAEDSNTASSLKKDIMAKEQEVFLSLWGGKANRDALARVKKK